jgi:Protein of unknown function, DUF547
MGATTHLLRRSVLGGALAVIASSVASRSGLSAPSAQLWQKWSANDPGSRVVIDHQAWGTFLRRYLVEEPDGIDRLRYGQVSAGDRQELGRYLENMSQVQVTSLNPAEQFAYWVNLYNALTVKVVLDHYPVASIRDITLGGSFLVNLITGVSGPWQAKLIQIEGEAVGLDDIEHRILRPLFKDNRVHYAVNCASIGCPTLMQAPFSAKNLQVMLDRGARLYVNHPRGARAEGAGLTVSSIYHWYKDDFGGSWQGVLAHLRRYANPATAQMLASFETTSGDSYDWQLIDTATYSRTAQAHQRG